MPLPGLSDLPFFRTEWAVLLECASPASDPRRLVALAGSADWSRLLILAEEHGVLAHLAKRLHEFDENLVPAEIRQTLLERQRAQVFSTLRMTAELFRLLELFSAKDIPALVVKGPVLAMQAYGDPAMRSYGDLDLLVRQRDIRRATESLQAAGYQAAVPLRAIDAGKIPGQYLFSKPDAKLLVELHNDFTLRYFPRRLPIEEFFGRQIRVRLDGHDTPALSVEDELVLICIHGAKHLWERLIWIADVAALVSRQTGIDWGRASASARAVRAEHLLNTGLRLAADVLHAHLPEDVSALVRHDGVARETSGGNSPLAARRGLCATEPVGTCRVSPAHARRGVLSAGLPAQTFSFSHRGRLETRRSREPAQVPRCASRSFRLGRKYGRGNKF